MSPDGAHVYVAGGIGNAVAVFSRAAATGKLTFVEAQFDGVGGVDGLRAAWSVAVSPDGEDVYVAGRGDDAVAVFNRDGATGRLTFVEAHFDDVGPVDGLDSAWSVVVSPDGAYVYVSGRADDAVAVFRRSATTGALSFLGVRYDGVGRVDGLAGTGGLTVSPDGMHVYATGFQDDAVAALAVFELDHFGCYRATRVRGEATFEPVDVTLTGPLEPRVVTVVKPQILCAPADKDTEGITDADTHLEGYRITLPPTAPSPSPEPAQRTVRVVNELGEIVVRATRPAGLFVPTAASLAGPSAPPDPGAHRVDHYECYGVEVVREKVCAMEAAHNPLGRCTTEEECGGLSGQTSLCSSPPAFTPGAQVVLDDGFITATAFELKRPNRLCMAAGMNDGDIKNPHVHLMCYAARQTRGRCAPDAPEKAGGGCEWEGDCGGTHGLSDFCVTQDRFRRVSGIYLNNELGPGVMNVRQDTGFCVPSAVVHPSSPARGTEPLQ